MNTHITLPAFAMLLAVLTSGCIVESPVAVEPNVRITVESVYPWFGFEGTTAIITGTGFGTDTNQVTVTIGGIPAHIVNMNDGGIAAIVPMSATVGDISVRRATATSSSQQGIDFKVAETPFHFTQCEFGYQGFREVTATDISNTGMPVQSKQDTGQFFFTNRVAYKLWAPSFKSDTLSHGDTIRIAMYDGAGGINVGTPVFGTGFSFTRLTVIVDTIKGVLRRVEIVGNFLEHWQSLDSTNGTRSSNLILIADNIPYQHPDDTLLAATISGEEFLKHLRRFERTGMEIRNSYDNQMTIATRTRELVPGPSLELRLRP